MLLINPRNIRRVLGTAPSDAVTNAQNQVRTGSLTPKERRGHDEVALAIAARLVEQLGLETVVLREEPDKGRTIIEKFEDYAKEVGFAIVLLPPDDLAGPADGRGGWSASAPECHLRAWLFLREAGPRPRVFAPQGFRKDKVEIRSDLYGVIYTEMDAAEGWKRKLARELKEAGINFDPDKPLE